MAEDLGDDRHSVRSLKRHGRGDPFQAVHRCTPNERIEIVEPVECRIGDEIDIQLPG